MTPTQVALAFGAGRPDLLQAQLVQLMARKHSGKAAGVSAEALAAALGTTERTLRRLISAAREDGCAIAGTPESGYYVARTAEELRECCAFLRARAMHSLRMEARLRKIALPELLGQLRVPT